MSDSPVDTTRSLYWFSQRKKVDPTVVYRAVKSGRLPASCLVLVDGKPKIADVAAADAAWAKNSDYTTAPAAVLDKVLPGADGEALGAQTMSEASLAEKIWKAKIAELKFKEAAKELVPARDVESKLLGVFSECRTKLLSIPSRVRQQIPTLGASEMTVIEELVREALTGLAQ